MSALVAALAAHDPQAVAVDPAGAEPLTYAALAQAVAAMRPDLALFDRARPVALQLDHGVDELLWELALLDAGIPVLSLPTFYTAQQSAHALAASGAQALVTAQDVRLLDHARVQLPAGTARITFTSGSTGTPRGICLSEAQMLATAQAVIGHVGSHHAGRHLALLPPGILLETVAGLFATLLAGGTYVVAGADRLGLANPFRPDFASMARAVTGHRATSLILVPELLAGLVGAIDSGCSAPTELTLVAVGGARIAPALIQRARAAGIPVRQGYGLTECCSVVTLQDADDASADNAGRALGHQQVSIAADGEILVSGTLCLGAIGGEPLPSPYPTGDIGSLDEQGRLHVTGRKSSMIVTSHGRNLAPEWLEEVLLAQPAVAQCMAWGDGLPAPRALLVPAHPQADLAAAVAAANAQLPEYARIAGWQEAAHFLPDNGLLTGNGRLRRQAIAAAYLADEPAFFTRLEADTVRQRLAFLSVPQVQAGLAGTISLRVYRDYLTQAYHHVSHTVPLMQAARARLLDRPELVAALDEYIEEETGHEEWILGDIAAAGGDKEWARNSTPHPATRAMVDHAYRTINEGNPVCFFGMVYVLESVSVAL
ncbi:MAG: AMP-binding protein, partial [Erythrobacter sp.]|nr:AMP-binding protein [Erythrobacter sp.]